ncbi:MAG: sulfatase-like hydrolase/transferase, partial [Deltaproteobacteria bacterium]|nr:sulfatase-like hydrolase/transferase [Deltaproteobacteria bacterium]
MYLKLRSVLFFIVLTLALNINLYAKPNIVFFFVDDLGYGDMGCFWQDGRNVSANQKFDTPHLDKMAADGIMLTNHYVAASVCAPSRGSLLSGRHQGHCDVRDNQFDKAMAKNHSIGSVLQEAGYYTAFIGKGGLAGSEKTQLVNYAGTDSINLPSHPLKQGFDRFFGYHFHNDGHHHYPKNGMTSKVSVIYDDYRQVIDASLDLYTTDAWTAAAKKVIIDESTDGDDQPFFIYLAYDTPHTALHVPTGPYPPLDNDGDPTTGGIQWTTEKDSSDRVRYASNADGRSTIDNYIHPSVNPAWTDNKKRHVTMIRRIDDSVGDIINTLKEIGIDDNTLLIFASDNGPHGSGGANIHKDFESFANFEGIKRDMLEGGIRTPTIVRWPAMITGSGNENNITKVNYPSGLWDWMPTFAEIAGLPAPAWCDGVSLLPTITGTGTQRDKGYLYFEYVHKNNTPNWTSHFPNHAGEKRGQQQCIRIGDYMGIRRAISTGKENFSIYDITTDTSQGTDLRSSMPDLHAQMQKLAITSRRPNSSAPRPYDSFNLPADELLVKTLGVSWRSYNGPFPWV